MTPAARPTAPASTPPPESLSFLLHDAARLIRRRFQARSADLGLTPAQWRLLVAVLREERPTQARIAERLEIEPISVSRLIDRMAEAGWVRRTTDPADRRIRIVELTDMAQAARGTMVARLASVVDEAFAGFTEAERRQMLSLLTRLAANLSDACASEASASDAPASDALGEPDRSTPTRKSRS